MEDRDQMASATGISLKKEELMRGGNLLIKDLGQKAFLTQEDF